MAYEVFRRNKRHADVGPAAIRITRWLAGTLNSAALQIFEQRDATHVMFLIDRGRRAFAIQPSDPDNANAVPLKPLLPMRSILHALGLTRVDVAFKLPVHWREDIAALECVLDAPPTAPADRKDP